MKITDEILLDFIDGNLSQNEALKIKSIINEDEYWRKRLDQLQGVDSILKNTQLKSPSQDFASKVMFSVEQSGKSIKKNGLFIFGLSFLTIIAASYYMTSGSIELTGFNGEYMNEIKDYLPNYNLPKSVNMKVINSILICGLSFFSLLIFDKTVLQPYFRNRRTYS